MFLLLIRSFNPSVLSAGSCRCLGRLSWKVATSPEPLLSTSLPDGGCLEAVPQNNLRPVPAESHGRSRELIWDQPAAPLCLLDDKTHPPVYVCAVVCEQNKRFPSVSKSTKIRLKSRLRRSSAQVKLGDLRWVSSRQPALMCVLSLQMFCSDDRCQCLFFSFRGSRKDARLFTIPSGKESDRLLWGELTARTIG